MRSVSQTEERWRAWLYRQARCYTHCADTVEDWVQEVLVAFWQRFGLLPWEQVRDEEERQQRGRWCRQKLRWLALDSHKCAYSQHERLTLEEIGRGEGLAVAEVEAGCLERLAIEEFVGCLPGYLQRVAVLYNEGYSYKQIAQILGVSVGTVQGYLGRIRVLGQEFFGVPDNKSAVCALTIVNVRKRAFQPFVIGCPTMKTRWCSKSYTHGIMFMAIYASCVAYGLAQHLHGIQCTTISTLSRSGSGSCGDNPFFPAPCPWGHRYCSDFWRLCEGGITTQRLNVSYLTLGLESSGGSASMQAEMEFSFRAVFTFNSIPGYTPCVTYKPKMGLGFLFFVDLVKAWTLAGANARCGHDTREEDGCCEAASASATASARVNTSVRSASISATATASCSAGSG